MRRQLASHLVFALVLSLVFTPIHAPPAGLCPFAAGLAAALARGRLYPEALSARTLAAYNECVARARSDQVVAGVVIAIMLLPFAAMLLGPALVGGAAAPGLFGAAATSSGLATLGGGALAIGGGGMAAGSAVVTTLAGVASGALGLGLSGVLSGANMANEACRNSSVPARASVEDTYSYPSGTVMYRGRVYVNAAREPRLLDGTLYTPQGAVWYVGPFDEGLPRPC